jgi:hypothetical protein
MGMEKGTIQTHRAVNFRQMRSSLLASKAQKNSKQQRRIEA